MTELHRRDLVRPTQHHPTDELARYLFQDLPRADQRRWAAAYLRGLCSTPGKKSVRNMAWAVSDSDTAWQSLHQIVNASTWRWEPVRRRLTRWCTQQAPARALMPAPVLIPKRGQHSVGVHKRFDPESGRTVGCQWAVGLFLATEHGTTPVDWRLHLPGRWSDDTGLRARVCAPEARQLRAAHELTADLLDSTAAPTAPVLATATTHAGARATLSALATRRHEFALRIPADTPVTLDRLRPTPTLRSMRLAGAMPAWRFLQGLGRPATRPVAPATPDLRAAPALVRSPGGPHALHLLSTWPHGGPPGHIWLTNMPLGRLQPLTGFLSPGFSLDTDRLQDHGLYDFEGRSYPGWHRHMTLVSAADAHRLLATPAWQQAA